MSQVTFDYPYYGYSQNIKYQAKWSESRQYLNGSYTYPIIITNSPKCTELKVIFNVWSDRTGLFNREWQMFVYDGSYWSVVKTFALPAYEETGDTSEPYYASCEVDTEFVGGKNIYQFACVPSSRMSSSTTWSTSYSITKMRITDTVSDVSASEINYICGLMPKPTYSVYQTPSLIKVKMNDALVEATQVMVNVDGNLVTLPKMKEYIFNPSTKESSVLVSFVAVKTAKTIIDGYSAHNGGADSGYGYFKVFDDTLAEITTSFSLNATVELVQGKTYYILVIDSPYQSNVANRQIKIYNL